MPDHVIAGLVALAALGVLLAAAARAWWTAPVVEAIDRLRRDTNARLDGAYEADREAEAIARKDPRP